MIVTHDDDAKLATNWADEFVAAVSRMGEALHDFVVALGWLPSPEEIAHQQRLERHMARCARRRLRRKARRRYR